MATSFVYWYVRKLSPHYLTSPSLSFFICKMEPQWFWLAWVAVRVNICSWVNVCSALDLGLGPEQTFHQCQLFSFLKAKIPFRKFYPLKIHFLPLPSWHWKALKGENTVTSFVIVILTTASTVWLSFIFPNLMKVTRCHIAEEFSFQWLHLKWKFKTFWSKFYYIKKYCVTGDSFTSNSPNIIILNANKLDTIYFSISSHLWEI